MSHLLPGKSSRIGVFADCRPEPAYLTLVEALSLPGFKITEVSEGGSVPSLRVINETPQHVLLFDGEELKGAKQTACSSSSTTICRRCCTR